MFSNSPGIKASHLQNTAASGNQLQGEASRRPALESHIPGLLHKNEMIDYILEKKEHIDQIGTRSMRSSKKN